MEKKSLKFLLKSSFLKRADISKCFDNYSYLSWIKDFKTEQFNQAANTLEVIGSDEKSSFTKKRVFI